MAKRAININDRSFSYSVKKENLDKPLYFWQDSAMTKKVMDETERSLSRFYHRRCKNIIDTPLQPL